MASKRLPSGVIDDVFAPLGKAAVHEVRQAVRAFVRSEHNLKPKIVAGTKTVKKISKSGTYTPKVTSGRVNRQFERVESAREAAKQYFKSEASFKRAAAEERGAMGLNPKTRNVKGK